jgi:hypothetical protein
MSNLTQEEKTAKARYKEVRLQIDLQIAKLCDREFHYHRSLQPNSIPPREFVHLEVRDGEDPSEAVVPYTAAQELYLLTAKYHWMELRGCPTFPLVDIPYQDTDVLQYPNSLRDESNKQRFLKYVERDAQSTAIIEDMDEDMVLEQAPSRSARPKL